MKSVIKWAVLFALFISAPSFAQLNGVYNATAYNYTTQVTIGNPVTGVSSIGANPTGFSGGIPFLPYNLNASITLNRNGATQETITPTVVANCFPNSLTCTLSGTFTYKHVAGDTIQSGTFGLQEALNVAQTAPSAVVLIDGSWGGPAGGSLITAAKGNVFVMIQDNRNPSGAQFYQWNGSAYALTGSGGAVSSVFTRTGAVVAQTGDYTCAQVTGCPTSVGVTSINGDTTAAQHITCTGTGLTCPTAGGTTAINLSGGAGTGAVGTGAIGQLGGYSAAGTTIGPSTGLNWLNPALSQSQVNSVLAAASGTVIIPNGLVTPFTPNFNVTTISAQAGSILFPLLGNGIGCNERNVFVTLTSGSNVAVSAGQWSASDVGKTIVAAGTFSGTQYVFTPTITVYTDANHVTMSANSPFTQAAVIMPEGNLDTTAIQNILNHMGGLYPGLMPSGCVMLTDTILWNAGQRIVGQSSSPQASSFFFIDGHDGIQQPDATGQGSANTEGAGLSDFAISLPTRVDSARYPISYVNSAGSTTVQQPLYRPDHYLLADTSYPLGPGWCTGVCQLGVASTTASSAVICVPNSYYSRLTAAAGNKIMFRDFPAMYVGTVTALSGAGCTGSTTGATISPALSSGGSYTNAQIEWIQTTSNFQAITSSIPGGTISYPFTVTFARSIAPTSASIANFPTHGRFKTLNGEEYTYIGANYVTGTAVVRTGPTTGAGQTGTTYVAPENPCPAAYEVPWPVQPTVNTNDSTPSGANYFPSHCLGAAAISFPQANGNTFSGPGLSKGFIRDIFVSVYDTVHPGTTNEFSGTCIYMAGNTVPYGSDIGFDTCQGTEYGLMLAPSSAGMAGVQSNAVDSVNNHFHDLTIRGAYIISITSSNQFQLNDVDAYSTAFDPYDGTQMGAGESLFLGYALNEQNGSLVTNTAVCNVENWNAEPEGGNGEEVPPYFESDCYNAWFQGNNFEGVPAVLGGGKQTIYGGQFSSSAAAPILNYGSQNVIIGTDKTSQGPVNSTYGSCSYCDWGTFNRAGTWSANGAGPIIAAGAGNRTYYDGDDSTYAVMGNFSLPSPTNVLGGFISNDEMASAGLTRTIDPTAPKGSYTSCSVSGSNACNVSAFNGFNGGILIGPYDRIQPIKTELTVWLKGSASMTSLLYVNALQPTANTCGSPGTIVGNNISITTSWAPYSFLVDLTSYSGCDIGFSIGPSSVVGTEFVSSPNFIPGAGFVHTPTTSYTAGASCPAGAVNGDILSFDGTHLNICSGAVVVAH